MINYAVCEINGKQVKIVPGKEELVNLIKGDKDIEAKVLLLSESDKLSIGKPYLKQALNLKSLGDVLGEKIRVSKFHAKANYRKVTGSRAKKTKVSLASKK